MTEAFTITNLSFLSKTKISNSENLKTQYLQLKSIECVNIKRINKFNFSKQSYASK